MSRGREGLCCFLPVSVLLLGLPPEAEEVIWAASPDILLPNLFKPPPSTSRPSSLGEVGMRVLTMRTAAMGIAVFMKTVEEAHGPVQWEAGGRCPGWAQEQQPRGAGWAPSPVLQGLLSHMPCPNPQFPPTVKEKILELSSVGMGVKVPGEPGKG